MNFEEFAAKPLLRAVGIQTPESDVASDADTAAAIAARIGACVVKAQVPTGKRGKAGGIKLAASSDEAREATSGILGMEIAGWPVNQVLVEAQVPIAQEMYAAILNDPDSKGPLLLFSSQGGMDIEEIATNHPDALVKLPIDIRNGLDADALTTALASEPNTRRGKLVDVLGKLYKAYAQHDAELLEINPLIETAEGDLIALDCKFTLDDSAIKRQEELAASGTPDKVTGLEEKAKEHDLKFIELDGNVGVLANGAGLTMTTMDAIAHYGGKPANFLEIGGESYTKGKEALELVMANPGVKSLLVNFCGAFARCDVMTEGLLNAWKEVKPDIPVFFTIHGTGEDEAIAMVRDQLDIEPYDLMDDAVQAAVDAAQVGRSAA